MNQPRDGRLIMLLVLMVAFQGYVALFHTTQAPDDLRDQEQMLLQHTSQHAPSRAHGEGDHQRFGGGNGQQPSTLYQVNGPPLGAGPQPPPPADSGGLAAAPAPVGVVRAPLPPNQAPPGSGQGTAVAGAPATRAGAAKHQPDATERLLLGLLYLESTGQQPLTRQQARSLMEVLRRSESTKEAIPNAKKVFTEVLTDEQKAFVETRRQESFQRHRPLPPEGMQALLKAVLKRI